MMRIVLVVIALLLLAAVPLPAARCGRGDYVANVTCGGQPNPCAGKPKHLTLAAEKRGFGTRLQVFKLKELEGFEDAGRCVIEAPDIRLPPGY